ncbi:hypothetical protein [Bacillus sp. FJAT-27445]|nr:hypothetical protein [Bacillus sp. FJAT-27445]
MGLPIKPALLTSIHHEYDDAINWIEVASRKMPFDRIVECDGFKKNKGL